MSDSLLFPQTQQIIAFAKACGASVCGIADIHIVKQEFPMSPGSLLEDLDWAISVGVRLSGRVLAGIHQEPTALYSFHYRRINNILDDMGIKIANYIQDQGFEALPIPASQISDWEHMKGHVCHRTIGRLAGNGFIGRSGLLIHPHYGAQVRYASILTNMPLEVGKECTHTCGNCHACVQVCPAHAIGADAKDFNRQACATLLKEFSRRPFIGQSICGVCVNACKGKK